MLDGVPLNRITCPCGHGYFTEDEVWVSGYLVRKNIAITREVYYNRLRRPVPQPATARTREPCKDCAGLRPSQLPSTSPAAQSPAAQSPEAQPGVGLGPPRSRASMSSPHTYTTFLNRTTPYGTASYSLHSVDEKTGLTRRPSYPSTSGNQIPEPYYQSSPTYGLPTYTNISGSAPQPQIGYSQASSSPLYGSPSGSDLELPTGFSQLSVGSSYINSNDPNSQAQTGLSEMSPAQPYHQPLHPVQITEPSFVQTSSSYPFLAPPESSDSGQPTQQPSQRDRNRRPSRDAGQRRSDGKGGRHKWS
jgi:hypothetical protein